jgi:adenosylhomocysteine nucleosidase
MSAGANVPLLFIAAEPRECAPWVARWEGSHRVHLPVHWARAGRWHGREVLAVANGAGAHRAYAAVVSAPHASAICNIGVCGALDASLRVGDIVLATEIRNGSRSYRTQIPAGPPAKSGVLISVSRIARTTKEKRKLHNEGAFIVEMEAAGAARASEERGVPFYCIRAVSDLATEDLANDFDKSLMPDGRFSVTRIIKGALGSPVERLGELLRLARRTALASANLGEFLANCTF